LELINLLSKGLSFLVFVWEALQDMTLMIPGVCAFVSLLKDFYFINMLNLKVLNHF